MEGGHFFANHIASDPKWVVCLATRLELVFHCQNNVRDVVLVMGRVIGDSLIDGVFVYTLERRYALWGLSHS